MKYTFSFQTNFLPPPFAYAYVLSFDIKSEEILVDFKIEYLERGDFSPEMLAEEGAEIDDYFDWTGKFDSSWKKELVDFIISLETDDEQPDNQNYLHLESEDKNGFVIDTEYAEYRLQEIIQAIYEVSNKEQPLSVSLINAKQPEKPAIFIEASFYKRDLEINNKKLKWKNLTEILGFLENLEFDKDSTGLDKPGKKGLYINYGDDTFFKIESLKGATDPELIIRLISEKIEKLI